MLIKYLTILYNDRYNFGDHRDCRSDRGLVSDKRGFQKT